MPRTGRLPNPLNFLVAQKSEYVGNMFRALSICLGFLSVQSSHLERPGMFRKRPAGAHVSRGLIKTEPGGVEDGNPTLPFCALCHSLHGGLCLTQNGSRPCVFHPGRGSGKVTRSWSGLSWMSLFTEVCALIFNIRPRREASCVVDEMQNVCFRRGYEDSECTCLSAPPTPVSFPSSLPNSS